MVSMDLRVFHRRSIFGSHAIDMNNSVCSTFTASVELLYQLRFKWPASNTPYHQIENESRSAFQAMYSNEIVVSSENANVVYAKYKYEAHVYTIRQIMHIKF